jgi:Fe-S-cluster containining protein
MTTIIDRTASAALAHPSHAAATLPECASCPAHCCKGDTIMLHPEMGDPPFAYQVVAVEHPITGAPGYMLAHKPNGDCIYLGEVDGVGRCTIYSHRPAICRRFDCGLSYASMPRRDRKRMLREGLISQDVVDQGRKVQERRARENEAQACPPTPLGPVPS